MSDVQSNHCGKGDPVEYNAAEEEEKEEGGSPSRVKLLEDNIEECLAFLRGGGGGRVTADTT